MCDRCAWIEKAPRGRACAWCITTSSYGEHAVRDGAPHLEATARRELPTRAGVSNHLMACAPCVLVDVTGVPLPEVQRGPAQRTPPTAESGKTKLWRHITNLAAERPVFETTFNLLRPRHQRKGKRQHAEQGYAALTDAVDLRRHRSGGGIGAASALLRRSPPL